MSSTRVLLVCAGNTCRIPMAEDIARRAARARGLDVPFASAGLIACDGDEAAPLAAAGARDHGGDLSDHCSQPVTRRLLEAQDLVLVMEPPQVVAVERHGGAGRSRVLDDVCSVADPVLGTRACYDAAYAQLEAAIAVVLDRLEAPVVA